MCIVAWVMAALFYMSASVPIPGELWLRQEPLTCAPAPHLWHSRASSHSPTGASPAMAVACRSPRSTASTSAEGVEPLALSAGAVHSGRQAAVNDLRVGTSTGGHELVGAGGKWHVRRTGGRVLSSASTCGRPTQQ